jgi:peroxiredoxin
VDALAREVLAKAPHHPGVHHYRIHFWNHEKDGRALDSAAALGPSCPGIAHNWHMPGHTYSALHRHADAAWQQEASARVDHAHMIRYAIMPDEIHNYAHNNGWLAEELGFIGRVRDAIALARNLIELPRIPRGKVGGNTTAQDWNKDGSSWAEGRRRLVWLLLTYERWDEAIRLESTPHLAPSGDFDEDLGLRHLSGLAHFETGDALGGLRTLVALYEQEQELQKQRDAAAEDAEKKNREAKKSDAEIAKARDDARGNFKGRIDQVRNRLAELSLVQKLTSGDLDGAKARLAEVKGIPDERLSRYFARAADWSKALDLAKKAADAAPGQVAPSANYLSILRQSNAAAGDHPPADKLAELRDGFEKLRTLATHADLDLPAFRRLGDMAQGDWRLPVPPANDLGDRPPLDQLGPAHWSAPAAPAWSATGADGRLWTDASFAGKPHILVFYLGKSCTHCMEQLNAFAPKAAGFEAAGLPILAVGTDTADGLAATLAKDGNPFPFPLAADHTLAAFKGFRAHDDFENQPLHSTVLIDAAGRIRWQHISFNPFMKPDFLLEEAKRLMKFPSGPPRVAGTR